MKDEYLINFNLFCSRKKFSLYSFLLRNKEISYEDISEYFRNKNVTPPSRELFNKARQKVLIDLTPSPPPPVEEPKTKEVKKPTATKPKRKSRRRKNEQS